ncbi:MAG: hypothetical protein LIO96_04195 [Lachnospiraceae bacterium]|nr:hypothetical protein [Lachnospiraceae bacterium]
MPRKPKDIYQKLSDKDAQIRKSRVCLAQLEEERNQLDKERESFEMDRIFEASKEQGVPLTEVISLIEKVHAEKIISPL